MTQSPTVDRAPDRPAAARARGRNPHVKDFMVLRNRVREEGLMARSYGFYWARLIGLPLALVALGALSVYLGDTWWQLAVAATFALVLTQVMFLGHEAAHRQIFASAKWNEWVSLVLVNLILGMGLDWWQNKHGRHHSQPNQKGADPDVDPGALVYTQEDVQGRGNRLGRWITSKQGYYFFPLLTLTVFGLHMNSIKRLVSKEPGPRRWLELTFIAIRHSALIAFVFLAMSPVYALAFLGVMMTVFGFYMGMSFATNHIGMPMVPKEVRIDFLRRQVLMSRNIAGGRLMDNAMGGLNLQIEHHLFPQMSRPNLRRVAPMVREYCTELGIDYHESRLGRAYRDVASYINQVGRGGIDVWNCPLAATLRTVG